MSFLPQDPFMLLSYVNTKLRDDYSSFDRFCEDEDADGEKIKTTLEAIGYRYDIAKNKFI